MREIKDVLPIEMFERFPRLNLDGMMLLLLLRSQYPVLLCPRSRVRTTFLVWWWLRCAARMVSVRYPSLHLRPRTLLLLIFRADPGSVQHTRCGLGNTFGADARAIARVVARWGKICASN